jgi:hypothetical protein
MTFLQADGGSFSFDGQDDFKSAMLERALKTAKKVRQRWAPKFADLSTFYA